MRVPMKRKVNVKRVIFDFLELLGCRIQIRNGIVKVTTPHEEVWDFTIPQPVTKPEDMPGG